MKQGLILASGSPRRIEIFRKNGLNPEVKVPCIKEKLPADMSVEATVMYLALMKALDVERVTEKGFIVAADTVVYDGGILGKPGDKDEAMRMLGRLKGRGHRVLTGVAVVEAKSPNRRVFYESTNVFFSNYSEKDIIEYIESGEPMDKAGAYAIQGEWGRHVRSMIGDMDNVIGFPWNRAVKELNEMGFMGV